MNDGNIGDRNNKSDGVGVGMITIVIADDDNNSNSDDGTDEDGSGAHNNGDDAGADDDGFNADDNGGDVGDNASANLYIKCKSIKLYKNILYIIKNIIIRNSAHKAINRDLHFMDFHYINI